MRDSLERFLYAVTQRVVWLATFVAMRAFARFSIAGKEHLRSLPTPLLVIANHRSYWDAMIIGTLFPFFSNRYLPIGFLAADEMYRFLPFRLFLVLTGTYPAYKGAGFDVSLRYPRKLLSGNGVVVMFPFGKIFSHEDHAEPPRRGIAVLAKEFPGLHVLPIHLDVAPNISFRDLLFRKKEVRVTAGASFRVDDAMRALPLEDLAEAMVAHIRELRPKRTFEEMFLARTEYCDWRVPEIRELAERLTHDISDERGKARAIFYWVRDHILYRVGKWNRTASETLSEGAGTCTNKANLLVALLRASGIPAGYGVLRVKGQEYFGPIVPPTLRRRVGERSVHVHAYAFLGDRWVKCDPSDDIRLSERTSRLNPQSRLVDWDGEHDAVLNLDPEHIIEDSGLMSDIDAVIGKHPRVSKRIAVSIGNRYIHFLREHHHLVDDVYAAERHFWRWLRRNHSTHYALGYLDSVIHYIFLMFRRMGKQPTHHVR